jgi:hypothetical protein
VDTAHIAEAAIVRVRNHHHDQLEPVNEGSIISSKVFPIRPYHGVIISWEDIPGDESSSVCLRLVRLDNVSEVYLGDKG